MKKLVRQDRFFVYIVKCQDRTYYTGYTNDLQRRVAQHNKGKGTKYLRGKLPVKLVYTKNISIIKMRCMLNEILRS